MSDIKDGGPAFPFPAYTYPNGEINPGEGGMTLRDYFAAKALPAIASAYVEANGRCIGSEHFPRNAAAHAYTLADAMLAAREVK
jgi:hypothetical protein